MAKKKVAINGFGRIGRLFFRSAMKNSDFVKNYDIVAVNDLTDAKTLAHLLKYDSVHGVLEEEVTASDSFLFYKGKEIKILAIKDPTQLPWKEYSVDLVVECTGLYTKKNAANIHLDQGAKKVLISAPAECEGTFCLGVNADKYDSKMKVVSMASCTTNSIAPLLKVLCDEFGVKRGTLTTIHAYTNDQRILDLPHSDLRRARAAALSLIPSSTGAAKAIGLVIPELNGKMDGISIRAPVPDGSISDLTLEMNKTVTAEEINKALKKASEGKMKGIMQFTMDQIVSSDIIGNPHTCIVDGSLTKVMDGNLLKVFSWYDNEWGYSSKLVEFAMQIVKP